MQLTIGTLIFILSALHFPPLKSWILLGFSLEFWSLKMASILENSFLSMYYKQPNHITILLDLFSWQDQKTFLFLFLFLFLLFLFFSFLNIAGLTSVCMKWLALEKGKICKSKTSLVNFFSLQILFLSLILSAYPPFFIVYNMNCRSLPIGSIYILLLVYALN